MRSILLVLVILIFASNNVFAQNEAYPGNNGTDKKSYPVHVSDKLISPERLSKLYKYSKSKQTIRAKSVVVDEVGDERKFFVSNLETDEFERRDFRLYRKGNYTQIWLEIAEIDNGHLNEDVADSLFKYLEEASNPNSFNPDKGIIELSNEILGSPPDYDGDGLVDFLITDIKDGWDPQDGGGYTAGFFYGIDQYSDADVQAQVDARSNERDVLYIDSYPGIYSDGQVNAKRPLATLSHEYQHLIHFNYNDRLGNFEYTFIDEAQANFSALLNGYFPHPSYGSYFLDTNVPIFKWDREGDVLVDYARAASFASYLWNQFGFENAGLLTQNPQNGSTGVNSVLSTLEADIDFGGLLVNWGIANLINDISVDPSYGYAHPFLSSYKVEVDFIDPSLSNDTVRVEQGGIEYLGFSQVKNMQGTINYPSSVGEAVLITKNAGDVNVTTITDGQFSLDEEITYDEVYIMLVNKSPSGDGALESSYKMPFSITIGGEKSFTLSSYNTYSNTAKFFWEIPTQTSSGDIVGFSNKFTAEKSAQLHFLELYLVSGTNNDGGTIEVKGDGELAISLYSGNNGKPDNMLAADTVDFSELTSEWVRFDVRDWEIDLDEGGVFHVVYEAIVPAINPDEYAIPLRLDDGTGQQSVTNLLTEAGEFSTIFADSLGQQYGIWNRIVLAEEVVTSNERLTSSTPQNISLYQNYPNPFNPTTNIQFELAKSSEVTLEVFDMTGRKVSTLVNGRRSAGQQTVQFDASGLASGVYIYKLTTPSHTINRQMVLIK